MAATPATSMVEEEDIEWLVTFLDQYYRDEIGQLGTRYPSEQQSLWVNLADLVRYDEQLDQKLIKNPESFRGKLTAALRRYDLPVDIELSKADVRVTDPDGMVERKAVSDLVSDDVETFVAVKGQFARVTGVKPRVTEASFECKRCGTETIVRQVGTGFQDPHECPGCERKGPFRLDLKASELIDERKAKLEEPPEDRTQGEGESITVYIDGDLCHVGGENGLPDRSGEQVVVFGRLRGDLSGFDRNNPTPDFDCWLEAWAIDFIQDDFTDIDIEEHRDEFESYASGDHGDPVELCKQSITPSLDITEELDIVLEAGVAWLFNSFRIDPEGLDQMRGDLHVAIIGDPATGKSSVLTNLSEIAPKCEFRSGAGLSKVGLTAAAKQEEFAGKTEWTLQPGILPRANGGHCIIDEVDDVIDEKTKAIHDALEGDQMVKVDKAGISADLPTRAAVMVSGNPVHGRYDEYEPVAAQIDLDPALISRMDVLLALQDTVNEERDRKLAAHKLDSYQELSAAEIAERTGETMPEPETVKREVPINVFRSWIQYARENCFPRLTEEARTILENFYVDVRNRNAEDSDRIAATPRSLDAGIRISTAFARVELSETVDARHAERAVRLTEHVVGLNYDPEAGEYDVDSVEVGQTKTQRDRIRSVKELIEELSDSTGVADREGVLKQAEELGIKPSKTENYIQHLRGRGEVIAPEQGRLKLV